MSRSPLPSRRRSVRVRRLLWRWRYLLLAVSVLVATGVVLGELRPPEPVTTDVVVLARDVPAGSELAAGDLTLARLPPELAVAEAAGTPAEVLGRRLAVGLPAGFPLTERVLVGPGLVAGLPPGTALVPVRLADPAVAAALHAGDRVDLMSATADSAAGAGGAEVVAADAVVVSRSEATAGGLLGVDEAPLVFVAVPHAAVTAVVGASAWAPLRVVLTG